MLPLATVSFVLVAVALLTVYTGELYPLRPETIGHLGHLFSRFPGGEESWGGPTLIGAWFVHAPVGFGIQVLALTAVRALAALSAGLADLPCFEGLPGCPQILLGRVSVCSLL